MRKFIKISFVGFIVCILLSYKQVYGQQNHFIYIQADDKQTFSVNLNNKTFTSSDIGYVIIPKLTDGKYQLNISFPNNKFPDQQFNCVVNKDEGYALKNFGDKGWGLFNFQSLEVTMAGDNAAVTPPQIDTTKTEGDTTKTQNDTVTSNAFGEMLSQVVNDTSLKTMPVDQPVSKPTAVVIVPAFPGDSSKNAQTKMQATDTMAATGKSIVKIDEQQTGEGVNMVFVDPASGNDTIKIFLPSSQEKIEGSAIAKNEIPDSAKKNKAKNGTADTTPLEDKNSLPDTSVALQSQVNNPFFSGKDTTAGKTTVENNPVENNSAETSALSAGYKQDCKKMVTDDDMDRLKKKLGSGNSVDKMIQTAKKFLQDKCLTTEQVKSLGALFLSDDARYSFYDAAYPNVYDAATFSSLENQLVDPYYKKRFRAMLR
jgi:hypothetical protein